MKTIDINIYTTETGKQPFADWQRKLPKKTEAIVLVRLARVRTGNFGDCKRLAGAEGVYELRIDYGPGYRVYFGKEGSTIVILLVGGDKGSQTRDIEKAKRYWLEYKGHNHE